VLEKLIQKNIILLLNRYTDEKILAILDEHLSDKNKLINDTKILHDGVIKYFSIDVATIALINLYEKIIKAP